LIFIVTFERLYKKNLNRLVYTHPKKTPSAIMTRLARTILLSLSHLGWFSATTVLLIQAYANNTIADFH